jgi:hypothetical protein
MIQPYNHKLWQNQFKDTDIYHKLCEEFDIVFFNKEWYSPERYYQGTGTEIVFPTPRQDLAKPDQVYDLGCGWNFFKKYYPNIIGVSAEPPTSQYFYADIHDFVDDDYISNHQEYFESVFSICALHFIPLGDIKNRVLDFSSMIKPGGRGWLSMNAARMIDRDRESFGNKGKTFITNFIKQQINNVPDIQTLEIDLSIMDEMIDGNIQITFSKE